MARDGNAPVPSSLVSIAERVEARLFTLLDGERARWASLSSDLVEPLDALARLVLDGGKRLRPAFCHWGYIASGGDPTDERTADLGAAFEMLQAFALVHDDVMDGSSTRRGQAAVHVAFADRHAKARWGGEARRFGEGVAILVGDLAHVYADTFVRGAPDSVLTVWDELRVELNVGQYLDVLGTARADRDIERARCIARYKSGKYTIERPLHVGAALGGRLPEMQDPLSAYGDPLGEAFQLRDDVLGAFGDEQTTGKPVGDDLREGKPTPLLAIATARADSSQRAVLDRVGDPALDGTGVTAIQHVLVATDALATVEADIDALRTKAIDAVESADIDADACAALVELAHFVAERSA